MDPFSSLTAFNPYSLSFVMHSILDLLQQLDTIAGKRRGGMATLQLAYKSGGMPGCAAGQLFPFQQHHIAPAGLGQMIGDGTAMNAAANNDGLGAVGQGVGHQANPSSVCRVGRGVTGPRLPAGQRRMCPWERPAAPSNRSCSGPFPSLRP